MWRRGRFRKHTPAIPLAIVLMKNDYESFCPANQNHQNRNLLVWVPSLNMQGASYRVNAWAHNDPHPRPNPQSIGNHMHSAPEPCGKLGCSVVSLRRELDGLPAGTILAGQTIKTSTTYSTTHSVFLNVEYI